MLPRPIATKGRQVTTHLDGRLVRDVQLEEDHVGAHGQAGGGGLGDQLLRLGEVPHGGIDLVATQAELHGQLQAHAGAVRRED